MSNYEPAPAAAAAPDVENVTRGTLFALVALPVGVAAWVIIWSFGFIASIISFGIAWLAIVLYKVGSGGLIGKAGAVRVTIITLVTVALAIVAGLVSDVALPLSRIAGISPLDAVAHPQFGEFFSRYLSEAGGSLTISILMAIGFGVLGCFGLLRSAFAPAAPVAAAGFESFPPAATGAPTETALEAPAIEPTTPTTEDRPSA